MRNLSQWFKSFFSKLEDFYLKTIESFGARSFMPSVKFLTGLTGISGVFGNEEVITKTEVEKSVENEDHNFIKPDAQPN